MKRFLIPLLLCILLAGCTGPAAPAAPPQKETATASPSETAAAPAPSEAAPVAPSLTYTLYLPNDNADGFVTRTVQTSAITAGSILEELQKNGALPVGIRILSFRSQGEQLILDLNAAFGDTLNAMGTSGEYMIAGSLVNTFLNAFQAQSLTFTVEGQIFESGHVIYDFPLTFYE